MHLLRKITYGEFSEFVQEKKVHIIDVCNFFCEIVITFLHDVASDVCS